MIQMKGITKRFGSLVANDSIDIEINNGEIHALLGENGAGKSTLMSILFGLYQPDEGEIFIDGVKVNINNPNDATKLKIGMVHQHFKLIEVFSVLDNIILGVEDTKNAFLTRVKAREKITQIMERYHLNVDLDALIKDLSVGQQQKVEILKMLYRNSDILIFDEPTAVLTPQETDELISIMKGFAKEGKTIILITHKLSEIKKAAKLCTILRRGKMVATVSVAKTSTNQMAEMMVGHLINYDYKISSTTSDKTILEVKSLTVTNKGVKVLDDLNFRVNSGEIVGIAGIDGNGQNHLVDTITGLRVLDVSGDILLNGKSILNSSIRTRYKAGLAFIPEDRHKHGLVLDFTLANNLILQEYYTKAFSKNGFLKHDAILKHANDLIEKYDIRTSSGAKTMVRSMSGGNQQKAIVAREIEHNSSLLVAFQPTRGLDVGAIENIHRQLIKLRNEGRAVLLVSFELEEILSLSDRILVMYEGAITGQFIRNGATENQLGLYMSGAKGMKRSGA